MSRSYHKFYSYAWGSKLNAEYYRSCGKKIRREHKKMLRYALENCPLEDVDELLYHIPKRAEYNEMGAPNDDFIHETKTSLFHRIEGVFDDWLRYDYCSVDELRRYLIIRSRLKGYPLHGRRKYSYMECEEAF